MRLGVEIGGSPRVCMDAANERGCLSHEQLDVCIRGNLPLQLGRVLATQGVASAGAGGVQHACCRDDLRQPAELGARHGLAARCDLCCGLAAVAFQCLVHLLHGSPDERRRVEPWWRHRVCDDACVRALVAAAQKASQPPEQGRGCWPRIGVAGCYPVLQVSGCRELTSTTSASACTPSTTAAAAAHRTTQQLSQGPWSCDRMAPPKLGPPKPRPP